MDNTKTNGLKQKLNIKMIGVVIAVVVLALIVILMIDFKKPVKTETNTPAETTTDQTGTATEATNLSSTTPSTNSVLPKDTKVDVVGANPITKEGLVVTATGEKVKNDVTPSTPEAPQQTAPITKAQLPNSALKLEISASGYSPKEITAKSGAAVTLSVTSVDTFTHVFMFDDASLSAVAIGVGPGETRAITFNAPKAGNYTFRCDVPGHAARGETGTLIVK